MRTIWILLLMAGPGLDQSSENSFAATRSAVRFAEDVAPILRQHCVACHRGGGIASMAPFTSYETVRPWAKAMEAAVVSRRMPPWPADPNHSLPFRNDARLADGDIAVLREWVEAGAANGGGDSKLSPPLISAQWANAEGRKPDLVISMDRDVAVPAHGDMPYLRFLVKLPLTEDKWVAACETRPGNAAVVHHMAITEVELPEGVSPANVEGLELLSRSMGLSSAASGVRPAVRSVTNPPAIDMLAIYTPGSALETYGPDGGKLLKAGKNFYINFNIHYAGHGEPSTDRSQVAFWFRDTAPLHQIYRVPMSGETILANGKELLTGTPGIKAEGTRVVLPPIAAGKSDYELVAVTAFTQPVTIYQLHPHAHFRGRDFTYSVVYPDGRQQTLLTIPRFDFRWQLAYSLAAPLSIPAGSKLVVEGHYDNSAANTANPAPDKEVYFLDQNKSTDEMFSPFVQYSVDSESGGQLRNPSGLPVIEAVGCLNPSAPAQNENGWRLSRASPPVTVSPQASNEIALKKAAQVLRGEEVFELVGLAPFSPLRHLGQTVVVRGVLLNAGPARLNVTSLERVSESCRN